MTPPATREVPLVEGFASPAEFLRELEAETVLRVRRFLAEDDERALSQLSSQVASTEERRRARTEATAEPLPFAAFVRQLGLSPVEEALVAYLLFLREGVHLPRILEQEGGGADSWWRAQTALAVAAGGAEGAWAARRLLARDAPLVAGGVLAPLDPRRHGSLSDLELTLAPAAVARLLDDPVMLSHFQAGITVEEPRERLADLVVDDETRDELQRLIDGVAARDAAATRFGHGGATVLLFHGPPGTGKSFAARALAGELGRPLVAVDTLAALVHGGGEDDVYSVAALEARRVGGVLFLDEFDKLLGDSPSAVDERRFLTLLERAAAPVILTANAVRPFSPAIERRIHRRISFRFPGREQRRVLWQRMLPSPFAADGQLVDRLAAAWLSGGLIKNAVLAASHERESARSDGGARFIEAAKRQRLVAGLGHYISLLDDGDAELEPGHEAIADLAPLLAKMPRARTTSLSLVGATLEGAQAAARTVGQALGLPVLQVGMWDLALDEESIFLGSPGLPSFVEGAWGQFVALIVANGDTDAVAESLGAYRRALGYAAVVTLFASSDPQAIERSAGGSLAHFVGRGAATQSIETRLVERARSLGIDLGDVDWPALQRALDGRRVQLVGLLRLALACARDRRAAVVDTQDLLRALVFCRAPRALAIPGR